jgi:hypothetical protein
MLDIDPKNDSVTDGPDGITIEPLQTPDYPYPIPYPYPALPAPNPDPATWDRSELPANACVFRLHGVNAACFPNGGIFFTGSCSSLMGGIGVAPGSFYDSHACNVEPGCPTADISAGEIGYWWYLVDRGDATDLVICAPECAGSFTSFGGCLSLRSSPACTR